jgi:hypothetical protein
LLFALGPLPFALSPFHFALFNISENFRMSQKALYLNYEV